VDYVVSNHEGLFDFNTFEQKLKNGRVRLVSMSYTSNSTGHSIPPKNNQLAHTYGAKVLWTAHKRSSPENRCPGSGCRSPGFFDAQDVRAARRGILYGKRRCWKHTAGRRRGADVIEPVFLGGGTVADLPTRINSLLEGPQRFEAGIQNYPAQIASEPHNILTEYRDGANYGSRTKVNSFLTAELMSRYGDTGWFRILGLRTRRKEAAFELRGAQAECRRNSAELSEKSNIMIREGVFARTLISTRNLDRAGQSPARTANTV